ncbi:unnamed protein product, partial [Choristocarpus tenellus]
RIYARRKAQEQICAENAKILEQLVKPKPTGINFHHFEMDYRESRVHHRLARCDRTVGH